MNVIDNKVLTMSMCLNFIYSLLKRVTQESKDPILKKACIYAERNKNDFFQDIDEIAQRIQDVDVSSVYLAEEALGDYWVMLFNYKTFFNRTIFYIQKVVAGLESMNFDFLIDNKFQQNNVEVQKYFATIMLSLQEIAFSHKKDFISNEEFSTYIDKCNQLPKIIDEINEKIKNLNEQNIVDVLQFISMKLALPSILSSYMLNVTEKLSKQFDFDECD